MSKKHTVKSSALLFTSAILGLFGASVLYVTLPDILPAFLHVNPYQRFSSILLSLTLAFACGFFELRLCALSFLTLIRFFAATLGCYLQFTEINFHFLILLLFCGLEGFLFLSFCRLSFLFGKVRQISIPNKNKYTLQFVSDYLFHCGICCLLLLGFICLTKGC